MEEKRLETMLETMSDKEIKQQLLLYFNLQSERQDRLRVVLGDKQVEPSIKIMQSKYIDEVTSIMVRRLREGENQLISIEDIVLLIPRIIDFFEEAKDVKFSPLEREVLETYAKAIFLNLFDDLVEELPSRKKVYRWIKVLMEIANEKPFSLSETELLDEVTRRLYSREEFIAECNKTIERLNVDATKKVLIKPLIETIETEEINGMDEEIEKAISEVKEQVKLFLSGETTRIYGS